MWEGRADRETSLRAWRELFPGPAALSGPLCEPESTLCGWPVRTREVQRPGQCWDGTLRHLPVEAGVSLRGRALCHVSRDTMRVRWGHALSDRKCCQQLPQAERAMRSLTGRRGGRLTAVGGHPPHTHTQPAAHVNCWREGSHKSRASACNKRETEGDGGRVSEEQG